jgi:lipid-A-disaccharide synthase
MASHDLLLVAGEASGDLHGAALVRELNALGLASRVFGLGGDQLRAVGMETVAGFEELSVVGLWEVLRTVPKARRVFHRLLREVDRRRPTTAVLIDFPEFNLRLARKLKQRGVKVVYYVSPQVWAWRRGRLKMIGQVVDKMLVFFGFEVDFYQESVDVTHVGHPLVDEVPVLPHAWEECAPGDLPRQFQVALLPGSRSSEIDRMLPLLMETACLLDKNVDCRFVLLRAASVPESRLRSALEVLSDEIDVEIESEDRFSAIAASHLALCTSGTATLEVGLLGTPMIVVYRVGIATSLMGRLLIRIPHISLVNLVLGGGVMTELVQGQAKPGRISREAHQLLVNRTRIDELRDRLATLRVLLGKGGASRRAALATAPFLAEEVEKS